MNDRITSTELVTDNNLLTKEIPKETENVKEFQDFWGFYVSKGCYWFTEYKGKKANEIRVSNFVMEILYHLTDGTNNTKRVIKIQKNNGKFYLKEVYANEMTTEKFETILKSVGCTFKGSGYLLKSIFEYLMGNETSAKAINNLGYQKEFDIYAFSDSVINSNNDLLKVNELGIIKDNENLYYLPAFSKANIDDDYYSADRQYAYKEGTLNFTQWAKSMYETFGVNGAVGISYLIASLFRDIIFNQVKFFPFLFLFGEYGTGKTSFIENILRVFGSDTIGTPLGNVTTPGLSRETSQRINGLFYIKEFTTENSYIANPYILNAYDGSGRVTGAKSTDNKTVKHLPKSGTVFDGNYMPIQKDAVFSRLILLIFEENIFTDEQKKRFGLFSEMTEKGISQIVREILKYREQFKKRFKSVYKEHVSGLDNDKEYKDIPSRLKNHTALITSVYAVLHEFLNFPYSFSNLTKYIVGCMVQQSYMLEEIKDISNFWKSAEYFNTKGFLKENTDFIKELSPFEDSGFIFIKYDIFYTAYLKYCSENQLNKVDKMSLKTLLTSKVNKSFIPSNQKSRKSKSITKYGFGSCYQFAFTKTDDSIKIGNLELNL